MKKDVTLKPTNPIATFTDKFGDEQVIHRKKGRRLSVFTGGETPVLKMNRAAAILIGEKIKSKRILQGLTLRQLCLKAGLQNVNPKEYMFSIENATRMAGCRTGTLYALAFALNCEPTEIMPTVNEVVEYANINKSDLQVLSVS